MNERKLTKAELKKREDIIMNMKGNKRDLVKKYGKDAEAVMYGRATNMAKKQSEGMKDPKLTELIKDALKNPKKADLNKDGKLSDYEEKRGAAIEKSMVKEWGSSDQSIMNQSIHRDLGNPTEFPGLSQIMSAAEDAVDFYWDDWDEYQTDRDGLVMSAAQKYARQYHPEFMAMAAKMMEPIDEKKSVVTENKQEAFDELQMIMEQLYELSDQAKMIFRNNFPTEYRRLDAYGALDFGTSSNRYDVTLEGALENLDMEDDDEDLMEGKDSTHKVKYSKSNDTYQVWLGDEIVTDFATEERANAEAKRLNALQDAKRIDKAQMQEDMDLGHQDNEPGMLKGDLYKIGKYSMELYQMMDDLENVGGEVDFPHWWQSKVITAKNMISGAKHYLDFELKEPAIDAVVDATIDVVDEDTNQLGTDDDTGFQASLYTPNEMGAASVGRESASGAFEGIARKLAKQINEEEPGEADKVAANIQKAMNKHKKDDAKMHQLKKARTAMNKGDLSKAEKIAKRLAEKLKNK